MITIDPLDDQVVQIKKPERSRTSPERRSPDPPADAGMASACTASAGTGGADEKHKAKNKSRLAELAQRALNALRGATGEEEG